MGIGARAGRVKACTPLQVARWAIVCAILFASPARSAAQTPVSGTSIVRGRVIDDQSGTPLGGVVINVSRGADTVARGLTDGDGQFRIASVGTGSVVVSFRRLGYEPGMLAVDSLSARRALAVAMTTLPERLETITLTANAPYALQARLVGFEDRARRKAGGTYLRRGDFDAAYAIRVSDLMRRVPGTRIVESNGILLVASSRGYKADLRQGSGMAPCIMRVGVDGQIKEVGFPVDAIDPAQIHGIEIYDGPATMPADFGGTRTDSFCGLILIWTRIE